MAKLIGDLLSFKKHAPAIIVIFSVSGKRACLETFVVFCKGVPTVTKATVK